MNTKTETINVKVTPYVKRLALAAVAEEGHGSEANMIAEAIRRYCQNRKIAPITDEELTAHKAANARKKDVREALAKTEGG